MDNTKRISDMQNLVEVLRYQVGEIAASQDENSDVGNADDLAGIEQALDNLDSHLDGLVP